MPHALSDLFKRALAAQETAEGCFILLTINHADFDAPFRAVRNEMAVTSRGNVFNPFPIDVMLPDDLDDAAPSAPISIDNVSRELIGVLRGLDSSPTFLIEIVKISDPDTVEVSFGEFTATSADYDAMTITATVGSMQDPSEPACDFIFSPNDFPSLGWVVRSS
jgi:hypothetical protein